MHRQREALRAGAPTSAHKEIHSFADLRCSERPMPLGLQAVIPPIGQPGVDVYAGLRIALAPIPSAVFDVTVQRRQSMAKRSKFSQVSSPKGKLCGRVVTGGGSGTASGELVADRMSAIELGSGMAHFR